MTDPERGDPDPTALPQWLVLLVALFVLVAILFMRAHFLE